MRYGTRKKQPDRLEPLRSAATEKLVRAKPAGHFAALSRLAGSGFPARTQASAYLKITVYPGRAGVFVGLRICGTGGEFSDRPKVPDAPPGRHEVRLAGQFYADLVTTLELFDQKVRKIAAVSRGRQWNEVVVER